MMPHVFSDISTIDFFSFYKKYYSKIKIIVLNLGKPISPDKPKSRGNLSRYLILKFSLTNVVAFI